jgi:hypothetical protein
MPHRQGFVLRCRSRRASCEVLYKPDHCFFLANWMKTCNKYRPYALHLCSCDVQTTNSMVQQRPSGETDSLKAGQTNFLTFINLRSSLPYLAEPATGSHTQPVESCLRPHTVIFSTVFNITQVPLDLPSGLSFRIPDERFLISQACYVSSSFHPT